jgi:hypothetical protein
LQGFDAEQVPLDRGFFLFGGSHAPPNLVPEIFATQFSYVAVPEPAPLIIATLGLALLLRRRK